MAPAILLAAVAFAPLPRAFPVPSAVQAFAAGPDGRHFACARDTNWADVYRADTGERVASVRCADGDLIRSLAFSPDGKTLAAGAMHTNVVRTWDVATGDPKLAVVANTGGVRAVAYSPDGKRLVCGGDDGQVRVLDAVSGEPVVAVFDREKCEGTTVSAVAVHPSGRFVAAAAGDDPVGHVWRITDPVRRLTRFRGHSAEAVDRTLAFSPDGRSILTATANGVQLVETATGRTRWQSAGREAMTAVAFDPTGRAILAASDGGVPRVWDLDRLNEPNPVARRGEASCGFGFGGGRLFLAGEDLTVRVRPWSPPERTPRPVPAGERPGLIAALEGDDAAAAFRAVLRLSDDPASVGVAASRVRPVPLTDTRLAGEVRRLVVRLGADSFDARQDAERDLGKLAASAAPELRRALALTSDAEVADRLGRVLAPHDPDAVPLAASRWLEVLERVGTPAAVRAVAAVAGGDPDAAVTRSANEALARMRR